MLNLEIGLRGLLVAQRAIELIGTNIANTGTAGYHRQDLGISPLDFSATGGATGGRGNLTLTRRSVDYLLEQEIVRQGPLYGQIQQELVALQTIESSLGTIDAAGLATAINEFFDSLRELTASPSNYALREQALWAAQDMVGQFNHLALYFADLKQNVRLEANHLVDKVNSLATEVAGLNAEIQIIGVRGGNTSLLQDRRDQAINELGDLLDLKVETYTGVDGVVNVIAWGTPLVIGAKAIHFEASATADGLLGLSVKGANFYQTELRGGRLGGLLATYNEMMPDIIGKLDTLAAQIINTINSHHVQGVGEFGSFTSLTGTPVGTGTLASIDSLITAGNVYVRVIDQATGEFTRQSISVNPSTDTVASIAAKLNALSGISATVADSSLRIAADTGYKFDFLPAVTSSPYSSTLSGTAQPAISGLYTGSSNAMYTLTVVGTGEVSQTTGLLLEVRDADGLLLRKIDVGVGYAAGDLVEVAEGIKLSLSAGSLNDGETFKIQALAKSDTSGVLAAMGLNTFFAGSSAITMAIRREVAESPNRLAAAIGADMTDNVNMRRMAEAGLQSLAALGDTSPQEFIRRMMASVGQDVAVRQARKTALEQVNQQLMEYRDKVSGVDINEEAAKMVLFERMFQAMSKFIATQDRALQSLMELL